MMFVCPNCHMDCEIAIERAGRILSIALCPCGTATTIEPPGQQRPVFESDLAMMDSENRRVIADFLRGGIEHARIALGNLNR